MSTALNQTPASVAVSAPPCTVQIQNTGTTPMYVADNSNMTAKKLIQPNATFVQTYAANDPVVTWYATSASTSGQATGTVIPAVPAVNATGFANGKTSGALPTKTFTSATGAQVDTMFDRIVYIPVASTASAGSVTVALSPDGTTYSTLGAPTTPAATGTTILVTVPVPAAWYVKLTASNCTLGTATYH